MQAATNKRSRTTRLAPLTDAQIIEHLELNNGIAPNWVSQAMINDERKELERRREQQWAAQAK